MNDKTVLVLDRIIQASIVGFVGSMPVSIAFCQISLGIGWLAFLARSIATKRWSGFRTELDIPFLVFLALALVVSIFSLKPAESFISLKKFYLLSAVYLVAFNTHGIKRIFELVQLLVVMTALTGIYGLLMNLAGLQARLLAVQGMAMTSGGIFMIAGILFLPLAVFYLNQPGFKRYLFPVLYAITFFSLVLTKTVSAWLGWVAGILFILVAQKRYLIIGLLTVVTMGTGLFVFNPVSTGFMTYKKDNTWEARLTIWRIGWQLIKERPVLGTGLIDLGELYQAKRSPEDIRLHGNNRRLGHLHNNFIHIAATMGLAGLLSFLFLWWMVIRQMIGTIAKSPPGHKLLALALLAAVIGFLTNGMAEWNFGDSEVITIIWFLVGLSVAMSKTFSPEPKYNI